MNIIKTTIATAAVLTCCLGNELPAQANAKLTADQLTAKKAALTKSIPMLKKSLAYQKAGDWKNACTTYKAHAKFKQDNGLFNYVEVSGSSKLRTLLNNYNRLTAEANSNVNSVGSGICQKAGMTWTDVVMPTPPTTVASTRSVSGTIRRQCEQKWGTDFRMVKWCIDKQSEAARSLGY